VRITDINYKILKLNSIDGKLNAVTDKVTRNQIVSDIVNFQHYVETETFTTVDSWKDKYPENQQVDTFIKYFIKQWLSPKRMGWFDHYVPPTYPIFQ
jgi:hypothetical protein